LYYIDFFTVFSAEAKKKQPYVKRMLMMNGVVAQFEKRKTITTEENISTPNYVDMGDQINNDETACG